MKYRVGLCFTGYKWIDVEEKTPGRAWQTAREMLMNGADIPVTAFETWSEADMVLDENGDEVDL
jgi:hypothetical protein